MSIRASTYLPPHLSICGSQKFAGRIGRDIDWKPGFLAQIYYQPYATLDILPARFYDPRP